MTRGLGDDVIAEQGAPQVEHAEEEGHEQAAHDRRLDQGRAAAVPPRKSGPHSSSLPETAGGPPGGAPAPVIGSHRTRPSVAAGPRWRGPTTGRGNAR